MWGVLASQPESNRTPCTGKRTPDQLDHQGSPSREVLTVVQAGSSEDMSKVVVVIGKAMREISEG